MNPEIIYLAGPMSKLPAYNYVAFAEAKKCLENEGYKVVFPFDADDVVWNRYFGRDFDPYRDTCEWGDPKLGYIFLENQRLLVEASILCLLPNWFNSKGSMQEVVAALNLGKKIMFFEGRQFVTLSSKIEFAQHNTKPLIEVASA